MGAPPDPPEADRHSIPVSPDPTASPTTSFGARLPYLRLAARFWAAIAFGLLWAGFSVWVALPWIDDLAQSITLPLAIFVIGGIAILPGYLNAFLFASLFLDRPRNLDSADAGTARGALPPLTLLIAAYNEANRIEETLDYALSSDYPGHLFVIVVDDGSSDRTLPATEEVARSLDRPDRSLIVESVQHAGKAAALNHALGSTETELVASIDADTLLSPQALRRAVGRLLSSTDLTAAVAGAVMARNSRINWLTRLQEWDYQLGIASIKRSQAIWQSTLVAQGSFSVYRTATLRSIGGWPDSIAEDIVMTWALLAQGYSTSFEATAIAFTSVPEHFRQLARQRSRWARGMIESLREYGVKIVGRHRKATHGILIDLLFPWMDLCYTVAFLPGVILALTGNFAIVGPMTLAVIPINLLLSLLMFRMQRRSFAESGLTVRKNPIGFISYLITYQPMMSPLALVGYVEETFRMPRRW